MKRNTSISDILTNTTKFIDPATGKVLREGTTPTQTVGEFKANPTNSVSENDTRLDNLEKGMDELKELLVKALNK